MATDNTKGIPYGITDYARMMRDNYYYVDKTHYIPLIERAASFFFLIRPRRFGKSLTLNMLDAYYDINNENRFEELFKNQWIYQHPTPLRAKFLILRFNFSGVDPQSENLKSSFENYLNMRFMEFTDRYKHFFHPEFEKELTDLPTIYSKLDYINLKASGRGLRIYLIIDEYDNFTNSILATLGSEAYRKATQSEGFFRYFFVVLKSLTTGINTALERMFITGVSPITLDDVTSGFNIGANLSTSPAFNNLVGFSETELKEMLEYYHQQGVLTIEVDEVIKQIKPWYDNYCFSEYSLGENMYNSDMVLYYLKSFVTNRMPPREMIDMNIRMDYGKLRHLINIDKKLGTNFSIIREIIETGSATTFIRNSFSVDGLVDHNNFKSLLFFFGLLSIHSIHEGDTVLTIPNYTVREQMYNYLAESYAQSDIFRLNFDKLGDLIRSMAYNGDWQPVFTFIASELEKQSRIREFIDGEAHIKGFLLAYLGIPHYYIVLPEYELSKGYADYYFQPNPVLKDMPYAYIVEVKYMKRGEPDSRIEELKEDARLQLLSYKSDEVITSTLGKAQLKRISVIFRGWELVDMENVESE